MAAMRVMTIPILALTLCGCAIFGGEEPLTCSQVGCEDSITLEVGSLHEKYGDEMPLTIQACVAETCRSWILDADRPRPCKPSAEEVNEHSFCYFDSKEQLRITFPHSMRAEGELPVSLTIHSKDGKKLLEEQQTVRIEPRYPNGYECDKNHPCYGGSVDFSSQDR